MPTLPTACAALIAFVFALLFVAVFLGVGWRMGSRAVVRDVEAADVESLGGVTVVEDVEVFSYVFFFPWFRLRGTDYLGL